MNNYIIFFPPVNFECKVGVLLFKIADIFQWCGEADALPVKCRHFGYLLCLCAFSSSGGGNKAALKAHFKHSLSLFFTLIIAFLLASFGGRGMYAALLKDWYRATLI